MYLYLSIMYLCSKWVAEATARKRTKWSEFFGYLIMRNYNDIYVSTSNNGANIMFNKIIKNNTNDFTINNIISDSQNNDIQLEV